MRTEKRIELLHKNNEKLNKLIEALKAELKSEKHKGSEAYDKEQELMKSLDRIFNDMQYVIKDMVDIRNEYLRELRNLRLFKKNILSGRSQIPFMIRLKLKFHNLKMRILRGR